MGEKHATHMLNADRCPVLKRNNYEVEGSKLYVVSFSR